MRLTAAGSIRAALMVAAFCNSPMSAALELLSGVGAGVEYTDNAKFTASDKQDDWIVNGNIGASLTQKGGPLDISANTSLTYLDYVNNSYGTQNYFNLGSAVGWKQIEDRLEWLLTDNFSQASRQTIDPDTPDNTENINVFSFGPTINFPVNGRHNFSFSPVFRDYYYQKSDADNQQYGVSAGWLYQMKPTLQTGLSVSYSDVRYDNNDQNNDFTSTSYQAVLTGNRPRSIYSLKLGMTNISSDDSGDQNGVSGSFDWLLNLSGKSSLRTYLSSDISDSSSAYYQSLIDPDTGDYNNVQISGDTLRNDTARITYNRKGTVINGSVWTEWRNLNYKESPDDSKVSVVGFSLNRQVSPLVNAGLSGRYRRYEKTAESRTDKTYVIGGDMSFSLSRKLTANVNLSYQDKQSTDSQDEYSEIGVFAGVGYAFGDIATAK